MFKYRKEIDGLRGISIICVLLFHAKIPLFSGGFFGVDIFFVISGYLITNIILNLYNNDKFDIKFFYERRIRRIIPALYVVLIFLCVYSYFFQSPYFSKDLSQSIFFILGGEVEILNQSQSLRLLGLIFIDIFNYSLFFYTIKRLSATFTTLVDYVVPIVGIYVGYIFLDEVVNNIFFITLVLIFISLYLAVKDEARSLN